MCPKAGSVRCQPLGSCEKLLFCTSMDTPGIVRMVNSSP